jgi:hypothetical protein
MSLRQFKIKLDMDVHQPLISDQDPNDILENSMRQDPKNNLKTDVNGSNQKLSTH